MVRASWAVMAVMLVGRLAVAQVYDVSDAARDSHAINDQYFSTFMGKTNGLFQTTGWLHSEFLLSNPSNDPFVMSVDLAMNMPLFEVELPLLGAVEAGWLLGTQVFILPRESPEDVARRAGYTLHGYLGDSSTDQSGLVGFTGLDLYGEGGSYLRFGVSYSAEFESVSTSARPYLFSNFWLLENVSSFLDLGFDFAGKNTVSRFGSGLGYRFEGIVPHMPLLEVLRPAKAENIGFRRKSSTEPEPEPAPHDPEAGSDVEVSFAYNSYRALLANQHLMSVVLRWFPFPDPNLAAATTENVVSVQLGRYFPVYDNQSFGDGFDNAEWFFRADVQYGSEIKLALGLSHIPGVDWGWRVGVMSKYFGAAIQNDFMMDSNYTQPLPNTTFYVHLAFPMFND